MGEETDPEEVLRIEEERTRRAYEKWPDSEDEADDWSNAEEYE